MTGPHDPRLQTKPGRPYETDDGDMVPERELYRYECSCGWKGACWYASHDRAREHFDRHADSTPAPIAISRPWRTR